MADKYPKRLFHPSAPVCVDVQDADQEKAWKAQRWNPVRPEHVVVPEPVDPPADQAPGVVDVAGPEQAEPFEDPIESPADVPAQEPVEEHDENTVEAV